MLTTCARIATKNASPGEKPDFMQDCIVYALEHNLQGMPKSYIIAAMRYHFWKLKKRRSFEGDRYRDKNAEASFSVSVGETPGTFTDVLLSFENYGLFELLKEFPHRDRLLFTWCVLYGVKSVSESLEMSYWAVRDKYHWMLRRLRK